MEETYLHRLTFNEELRKKFSAKYLGNLRTMFLLLVAVIFLGVSSYISSPRTLNPEVNIPIIFISTILPGGSSSDVENLVTIPIEKAIKKVENIDTYSSTSQNNVSSVTIEFLSGTDIQKAKSDVQSAIDSISDLPEDATEPQVASLDFEKIPVIVFGISTKNDNLADLSKISHKLKNNLTNLESVDEVIVSGLPERQVIIKFKNDVILEKKLNLASVRDQIKTALKSFPSGNPKSENLIFSLTIEPSITNLSTLRNLMIASGDDVFKLGEIAFISENEAEGSAFNHYVVKDNKLSHTTFFEVYKTKTSKINEAEKQIQEVINETISDKKIFQKWEVQNYASEIDNEFGSLLDNFWQTLALVFLSMFLIYGARQAVIASVAIPLALLTTFIGMQTFGLTLNFLTIFSLLIALGLFVDNAVVIIEAFTSYHKTGKFTVFQTAVLVWEDYFVELFTINILTVWAFLPLLLATGIIGEFIKPLPIIVSVSMLGSAAVAFLFTLPSMMIFTKFNLPRRITILLKISLAILALVFGFLIIPKTALFIPSFFIYLFLIFITVSNWRIFILKLKTSTSFKKLIQKSDKGFISLSVLERNYRKLITKIISRSDLRKKTLGLIIFLTIFSYLLVPLGLVQNEFFPKTNQDYVYVDFEMPPSSKKEITIQKAFIVAEKIKNIEGVKFFTIEPGKRVSSFGTGQASENTALFRIILNSKRERKKSSIEIAENLREIFQNWSNGKVQVIEESGGPPAGSDIQISILGDNLNEIDAYIKKIENFLKNEKGVVNVERSIKNGVSKITYRLSSEKAKEYSVTAPQIGGALRTYVSGLDASLLTIDGEDLEITLVNEEKTTLNDLGNLSIQTDKGKVTLLDLGSFHLEPNSITINRKGGKRIISVTASVLSGFAPPAINAKLENYAKQNLGLKPGYTWETGGMNEENQNSVASIFRAMGVSAVLILSTMVLLLKSFRKAAIVMAVIPLALSGVFYWFALIGTPLSFPALIGCLSLFGIVIANSLMIVDKINANLEIGFSQDHAIIDAASSRLEPIALTSISQIIGLIPITLSDPLWQGLGGAIIAGMSFSGIIILFFIPLCYYYLFPKN